MQSSGNFLVDDYASLAKETTVTYPTLLSRALPVWDRELIYIQCKATGGDDANELDCAFRFVVSADGVNWTTTYFLTLDVRLAGQVEVVKGWHVNVTGIHSIRLQQIENEDTVTARTAKNINVRWGKSHGA